MVSRVFERMVCLVPRWFTLTIVIAVWLGSVALAPLAAAPPPTYRLTMEERNVLKAESLLSLAKRAKWNRRYREAQDLLIQITRLRFPPDREGQHLLAGAFLLLAEVHFVQNRYKDSRDSARQAIRLCGKGRSRIVAEAYKVLARIEEGHGSSRDAERFWKTAIELLDKLDY